ncbi:alpha/beta fold hydrolase [Bifidobacterium gallicum]|uniref:Alpha/beta hydrolase family protein n=1 Tax=Bifidobacterium gallicum DSM 20093 = LMG 11596 TaxID=561180 RepID=D1NW99_9BIFI|nr:alpha/beta hydrolase [Bifidobacterium gallicum]EFA22385.1 hydrolase, alpha/beta domain protein [Bifidobacterium gallicum DSM 20093 = LMG 11596]KFI60087.1 alpha/beta hydrolase family protein [Bifidobacterium gallicum DSM 20093 = LMG 11596]
MATQAGIHERRFLRLGGIDQFTQIRGDSTSNPVLLWVHGGPGFPMTFISRHYQRELEHHFTIATWEQRGSGRTRFWNLKHYAGIDQNNMTVDDLLNDMDEFVDYLRNMFHQDKIVILGQSWGTVLGWEYMQRHANKVSAYIGVGQVTNCLQGEILTAQTILPHVTPKQAEFLQQAIDHAKDTTCVEELDLDEFERMALIAREPLKGKREMGALRQMMLGLTSPDMGLQDMRWILTASNTKKLFATQRNLVNHLYYGFRIEDIAAPANIPLCFIQGECDWITPTALVKPFYEKLDHPNKHYVEIPQTGHSPFLDAPQEFSESVRTFLTTQALSKIDPPSKS